MAGNALSDPEIEMVKRRSFDFEKHVAGTNLRRGDVLESEHFGAAVSVDADGFHGELFFRSLFGF